MNGIQESQMSEPAQSVKAHYGTKKKKITQERLKELLNYDPETGAFVWVKTICPAAQQGQVAGWSGEAGYNRIQINGKSYLSSRLAWLYQTGYFPEYQMDHKNRMRHDDRWSNLRHVTPSCNARNRNQSSINTSGVTGVQRFRGKWKGDIAINRKRFFLGYYDEFYNAVLARYAAEQCLGWNNCDSASPAYKYAIKHGLIKP